MWLVFLLVVRCVYAGTPHAVYGVPPAQVAAAPYFGNSQPQRNSPVAYPTNPYFQQPVPSWSRNDYYRKSGGTEPPRPYWVGVYNNYQLSPPARTAASQTSRVNVVPASSAPYRPYSGSSAPRPNYNGYHRFSPPNGQYAYQRNDYSYGPTDSPSSRYNEFLNRYYNWYLQNYNREASERAGNTRYTPGYPQPTGDSGYHEPLGAYPPPVSAPANPPEGGLPTNSSPAPWWLSGGLTERPPVASVSSGGPIGPFTKPPPFETPNRGTTTKSAKLPVKGLPSTANANSLSVATTVADRIGEDPTSDSIGTSKSNLGSTVGMESSSESEAAVEVTTPAGGNAESESSDASSASDSMTTPESTASLEESSSASSTESTSASSEESSSPSSEESSSASSEEGSLASAEESSSPSSEEGSSPSSEESSSPSSEENSSASSEESSSPSSEESTSATSEDGSSTDIVTTESSDSSETNTIKSE